MACQDHQHLWLKYKNDHSSGSLAGSKRMLNRNQENLEWNPKKPREHQPHDEPTPDAPNPKHYFGPATFYCTETICFPCGVVKAWTKFAKSESESNILAFIRRIFGKLSSRPNYFCIDKACRLLKHIVAQGHWNRGDNWQATSRFIVDSYHYQNHKTSDTICQKYCNPAPMDGMAPNLVISDQNNNGKWYQKRAFNTQVIYLIKFDYICNFIL